MRTSWTEENIRKIAHGVTNRYELKKLSGSAYKAARITPGLLDDLFGTPLVVKWTEETLLPVLEKFESRAALYNEMPGAWLAAKTLGVLDRIFPDTVRRWTRETVTECALQYESITEFQKGSPGAYGFAAKYLMLDTLFERKVVVWTKGALMIESSKYRTLAEFRHNCGGAYHAALSMGIVCDLFPYAYRFWDSEKVIREEASKYNHKSEFMRDAQGAYKASVALGILNDLGFTPGAYGYDSTKAGYFYIADIWLADNTDGIILGITNKHPSKRYTKPERAHMSNGTAYMFGNGEDALRVETEMRRLFVDKTVGCNQSPLKWKLGTSGEMLTGIPRSLVEVAALGFNSNHDWSEEWA